MKEITIGSAVSSTPGVTNGWLKTGELPDSSPLRIPVVIVRGASEGPTLWLHGCVHGNEYCGAFVIHEALRTVDPEQLSGTVVALPVLNLTAFQRQQRMSPFEGYGGGDLNRCFPGSPDGSMTSQMAHAIYAGLGKYANFMIDFHGAYTFETRWSLFPDMAGHVAERGEGMARAWGFTALPTDPNIFDGMLSGSSMMCAARDGIPSLIVEIGGMGSAFDAPLVKDGAERMRNVMRYLGMLPGEVTNHSPQTFLADYVWIYASRGGLFMPAVKCQDRIQVGDVIGHFYDTYGDMVEEATTSYAGEVLAMNGGPLMPKGDTLIHIGLEPREV